MFRRRADGATVYNVENIASEPVWSITTMTAESAQKGGFSHFMLKEIYEQPEAIVKSVSPRIKKGLPDFSSDGIEEDFWRGVNNIQIVACGSAYHAGLVGKAAIEKMAKIPVEVDIASEFRYRNPLITDKDLVVIISQSGETADTLAALREAKSKGARVLSVVNVRINHWCYHHNGYGNKGGKYHDVFEKCTDNYYK